MNRIFSFLLHASSFLLFTSSFFLFTSCSPVTPTAAPEPMTMQYTAATTPWLADLYACAGNNIVKAELHAADFLNPQAADLVMRVGQPSDLPSPAYQISTDDILVIVNRQNPINKLTPDQVRGLFTGQVLTWKDINSTDAPVQVWVFPSGEDVQQNFEQAALGGAPIASAARLANTPGNCQQCKRNWNTDPSLESGKCLRRVYSHDRAGAGNTLVRSAGSSATSCRLPAKVRPYDRNNRF